MDPVVIGAVDELLEAVGVSENEISSGDLCGVLACVIYEYGWEIEFIHVDEGYRRQGIGRQMVDYLRFIAAGCGQRTVYTSYIIHEGNEGDGEV